MAGERELFETEKSFYAKHKHLIEPDLNGYYIVIKDDKIIAITDDPLIQSQYIRQHVISDTPVFAPKVPRGRVREIPSILSTKK